MFSLLSCASGLAELCPSISCESRSAQAIPAGPPPTMTTSAGICGREIFSGGLRKIISFEFPVSSFEMSRVAFAARSNRVDQTVKKSPHLGQWLCKFVEILLAQELQIYRN